MRRAALSGSRPSNVWIAPGATGFSCLCERCLDETDSLLVAVKQATVRGTVPLESNVAFAECPRGHRVVVRRVEQPPNLARRNDRQLQLA